MNLTVYGAPVQFTCQMGMGQNAGFPRSKEDGMPEEGRVHLGGCNGADFYRTRDRNRIEGMRGRYDARSMGRVKWSGVPAAGGNASLRSDGRSEWIGDLHTMKATKTRDGRIGAAPII